MVTPALLSPVESSSVVDAADVTAFHVLPAAAFSVAAPW